MLKKVKVYLHLNLFFMKKIQYFILSISLGIFALCDIGFSQSSTYYADLIADYSIINKQSSADWYRLNNTLTRAELAKIASNLWGMSIKNCSWKIFTDVQSTLWDLCGYIETLADAKVVSTSNKYYRPNDTVTRAEAIKILLGVIWAWKSNINAGYMDANNLGDLEWYINKAKEIWSIADTKYIYPNSPILRHEVFILAAFYAGIDTSNPAFAVIGDAQLLSETLFWETTTKNNTTTKSNTWYLYLKNGEKYEFTVPKITEPSWFWRFWYDRNFLAYAKENPNEAEFAARCDKVSDIEKNHIEVPSYLYLIIKNSDNPCQEWASYWIYDKEKPNWWYRDWDDYTAFSCDFDYDLEWYPTINTWWYTVTISDSEKKTCSQIWLKQERY